MYVLVEGGEGLGAGRDEAPTRSQWQVGPDAAALLLPQWRARSVVGGHLSCKGDLALPQKPAFPETDGYPLLVPTQNPKSVNKKGEVCEAVQVMLIHSIKMFKNGDKRSELNLN